MTHTATTSIPLTWREWHYSWVKVLTDESIKDIRNLFVEKLGEDFCKFLSFTKTWIEVGWWTGKKMLGRDKEWVITKIKEKAESFDFSTVEKKYTELARIAKRNVELENRRANLEEAISNFNKNVKIEWVVVETDYSSRASLKVWYQDVDLIISDEGEIENVKIKVPTSYYKSLEDTIAELQALLIVENRIRAELIGKNIYA